MKDEKTSRQERRRRRLRNQFFAYLILTVIIVLVLAAGFFGARFVISYVNDYNEKVNKVIEEAESGAAAEPDSEPEPHIEEMPESSAGEVEGYTPPVDEDPMNTLIESLLGNMTTEEMVAGMFVVTPESITGVGTAVQASDGTKTALTENPIGGLVYAPKNFQSPEQFTEMLVNTRNYARYPIFAIVSAECGSTDYGLEATQKASKLAAADSVSQAGAAEPSSFDNVSQAYGKIASGLAAYGINMNLAPVAEIVPADGDASLRERSFGSDAYIVCGGVEAAIQAMQSAGVSAVLQKFPFMETGSGTLEELQNNEFLVHNAAIFNGVDCIMVSHVSVESVTGDDTPSSLSPVMIGEVLRNTLGFNGIVMTDYLDDSAITDRYSPAEAAVAAVQAGADLLLAPENYQEAYEGILQAVADGTITQERIHDSVYRIYCIKYKNAIENL